VKSFEKGKGDKKMRISKFALVTAFVFTAFLFAEVAAHADETDQATKLTFNKPIAIPGRVLSAGSYLFKVDPDDSNIVRIYNADGTRYYATVQTIATDRSNPTGTVVTLAEQPGGEPEALLKWFYPGNTTGHEFVYSHQKEQQLAQDRQQTIVPNQTAEARD
jgi:hypothetical protein